MRARKIRQNAKRFVLALGLALLLPGVAGAAGFGPAAEDSLWGRLTDPAAFFARVWEGLTSLWTSDASVDPNGEGVNGTGTGTDGGGSIDPNG